MWDKMGSCGERCVLEEKCWVGEGEDIGEERGIGVVCMGVGGVVGEVWLVLCL